MLHKEQLEQLEQRESPDNVKENSILNSQGLSQDGFGIIAVIFVNVFKILVQI